MTQRSWRNPHYLAEVNSLPAILDWIRISKTIKWEEQDTPPSLHTVPDLEELQVKSSKRSQETPIHKADLRHNTAPEEP